MASLAWCMPSTAVLLFLDHVNAKFQLSVTKSLQTHNELTTIYNDYDELHNIGVYYDALCM